jgi:hypothetical protein
MDKQRPELERKYSRIDEPTRCALALHHLSGSGNLLAILDRHETRLRRIIDRATAELRKLQQTRGQQEPMAEPPREAEAPIVPNEPKLSEPPRTQPPANNPDPTRAAPRNGPLGPVLVSTSPASGPVESHKRTQDTPKDLYSPKLLGSGKPDLERLS